MTDGDPSTDRGQGVDGGRRALLGGLGAAGAGALAGCLGLETGDPPPGGPGQSFTTYMPQHHDYYSWDKANVQSEWPSLVAPYCFDRMATLDPDGSIRGLLATDWTHDEREIRVELAEGAGWSDGSDVLAADWALEFAIDRYALDRSPAAVADAGDPRTVLEATTAVEADGRTAILRSEPGLYGGLPVDRWLEDALTDVGTAEVYRHRSTLRSVLDELRAVDDPYGESGSARVEEILAPDDEQVDPTAVRVSGPFRVADLRPDKLYLTRNEHFRNADRIDFPRVQVLVGQGMQKRWAGLQSGTYDASFGIVGTPPAPLIDALPSQFRVHRWGGDSLLGLVANQFQAPHWGDPRVRQAVAYALDSSAIAAVQNEYAAEAPARPPGLMFAEHEQWVDGDLYESFRTYDHDPERAAERLRAAGFTRRDGSWHEPDGTKWTITVLGSGSALSGLSVLSTQLSEFGVETEISNQNETTVTNWLNRGNFEVAVQARSGSPHELYETAMRLSVNRHRFNLWSDDRVNAWVDAHEGVSIRSLTWTEKVVGFEPEQTKAFTLSAPPVGEPTADERVEYPVVYMDLMLDRAIAPERRREYVQALAWVYNWRLPIIPYVRRFNLAIQDHEDWNAPTDDAAWRRPYPTFRLLNMGRITAADGG